MSAVAHAHAAGDDWRRALAACGDALAGQRPDGALGLIYVTELWAPHLADMAATLKARLGVPHWAGCAGFGIFARDAEYMRAAALSVLVLPVAAGQLALLDPVTDEAAARTQAATPWCRLNAPVLGIVHADPRNPALEAIVAALMADDVGGGFVVGGLTALSAAPMQYADGAASGGVSGVLISSAVPVAAALSQGCAPIGAVHRVTMGRNGLIAELDGRKALDVLTAEAGEAFARDLRRLGGTIHVALPVGGSDRRDYTVRNLMGLDPRSGVIAVGADLGAGDALMFVRRDPAAARADFARALGELKARIGPRTVVAGHYVSCVARGPQMFGPGGGETRLIRAALGDFPLTGFFANGEICGSRIYGYTGVLTVFLDRPL